MAHREHVGRRAVRTTVGIALFAAVAASCSGDAPPQPAVNRGQVIDQDTEQPIVGVIVIGIYRGSRGFEGATSCNRVETAISDAKGWFTLPLDPAAGPLYMEGYHRDYRHGYPIRIPTCGIDSDPNKCDIWVQRRDDNDTVVSVVKEPTVYHGRPEAAKAARYYEDLYMKRFNGTRAQRGLELSRLESATSCLAPPKTSRGLIPFLEGILQEQIILRESSDAIRITNERLQSARDVLHRKER